MHYNYADTGTTIHIQYIHVHLHRLINTGKVRQIYVSVIFTRYKYNCFCVDPFADDNEGGGSQDGHIHIRIQQRNGRKTLTTVQGIRPDYDLKKIVKACKKVCIFSKIFVVWLEKC